MVDWNRKITLNNVPGFFILLIFLGVLFYNASQNIYIIGKAYLLLPSNEINKLVSASEQFSDEYVSFGGKFDKNNVYFAVGDKSLDNYTIIKDEEGNKILYKMESGIPTFTENHPSRTGMIVPLADGDRAYYNKILEPRGVAFFLDNNPKNPFSDVDYLFVPMQIPSGESFLIPFLYNLTQILFIISFLIYKYSVVFILPNKKENFK